MVSTVAPASSLSIFPPIDHVQELARNARQDVRQIPIFHEMLADTETPVSVYLKLSRAMTRPGFLLESIEGGSRIARYSFLGANPRSTATFNDGQMTLTGDLADRSGAYDDPVLALGELTESLRAAQVEGLPRFTGGAVGYLGYDAIRRFEPRVPPHREPGLGFPEAEYHIADTIVIFDHIERTLKIVSHVSIEDPLRIDRSYQRATEAIRNVFDAIRTQAEKYQVPARPPGTSVEARFRPNMTPDAFREMVRAAQEYILQGDIFQVVLSQRVDVDTTAHPFSIYRSLRTVNPSPYMFYLDFGDRQIVGASPELLVRVEDGVISNHPIAGTRPRGATSTEDAELEAELLADEKERAEHIMLVDLGRNDIGRVAKPGTVRLPKVMDVEYFSHVMHIVSNVDGDLRDDMRAIDALRACFPAGTVTGAPKVRAMEIIAELEADARGVYSGAVGYVDFTGEMDTCIALRTMVYQDGVASLQAGGGIVADSTPDGEYAESFHKMRALVRAIDRAERLEASDALSATEVVG